MFAVGFSNFGKELLCFFLPDVMAMPVNNYINAFFNGGIDHSFYLFLRPVGFVYITLVRFHAHGCAYYITTPVVFQPAYSACIIKPRPPVMPAIAHST